MKERKKGEKKGEREKKEKSMAHSSSYNAKDSVIRIQVFSTTTLPLN